MKNYADQLNTFMAVLSLILLKSVPGPAMPPEHPVKPNQILKDERMQIYKFTAYNMTIIGFPGNFEILYQPAQTASVQKVGQDSGYRCIVNGSFFEQSREHAGWLSMFGKQYSPLKSDRQLSHITTLNTRTGAVLFTAAESWQDALMDSESIQFQTGPLIVDSSRLALKPIRHSINGLQAHRRTILAFTEEDRLKYFIIVRSPGRLDEIGKYLLKLSIFAGKTLSAIDLDGGPSVALYLKDHPELSYNETVVLPILFGSK